MVEVMEAKVALSPQVGAVRGIDAPPGAVVTLRSPWSSDLLERGWSRAKG